MGNLGRSIGYFWDLGRGEEKEEGRKRRRKEEKKGERKGRKGKKGRKREVEREKETRQAISEVGGLNMAISGGKSEFFRFIFF